jgi:hypothetical protein
MKEDKRITEKDVDEAEVHLKPIFGITPGRYLTIIYALGIVTAFIPVAPISWYQESRGFLPYRVGSSWFCHHP